MLAAFILGLAPIFFIGLAVACLRRALPLAFAGLAAWSQFAATAEFWTAFWTFVGVLMAGVITLDILSRTPLTRPIVIALECVAGMVLALLCTFAVCYSGGLRDGALLIALGVSALVATIATLPFRLADEREGERPYRV